MFPRRIGVNRFLSWWFHFRLISAGRWATADGMRVWVYELDVPGARAVRVHFSRFELPAKARLLVYGESGSNPDVYEGRGPTDKGAFWAAAVVRRSGAYRISGSARM